MTQGCDGYQTMVFSVPDHIAKFGADDAHHDHIEARYCTRWWCRCTHISKSEMGSFLCPEEPSARFEDKLGCLTLVLHEQNLETELEAGP